MTDLILLHGWGMNAAVWQPLRQDLAPFGTLHTPNLPGYGGSPPVAPYTLDALATALANDIPPNSVVIGWSLGGLVAMKLALAYPERVARLVLIAANPCFVARPNWPCGMTPAVLREFAANLERDHARTLMDFLALQVLHDDAARATLRALRQALTSDTPTPEVLRAGLSVLRDSDLRAAVPGIQQPTLLLYGLRDTLVPPDAGEWLARALPQASYRTLAGAAHAPFLSHRPECLAELQRFLGAA